MKSPNQVAQKSIITTLSFKSDLLIVFPHRPLPVKTAAISEITLFKILSEDLAFAYFSKSIIYASAPLASFTFMNKSLSAVLIFKVFFRLVYKTMNHLYLLLVIILPHESAKRIKISRISFDINNNLSFPL